ncbi:hypothetical protein BEWA_026340 [Theileria equi strain WA]|uniref:Uncharacterized protein n=1 Tax=Theileria equi strain WA TaxID=1537102 RepID=L0AW60_THEEQ|nr:hypothetical protein BEWA_026340 [Theileria equi strain WA]AFZ79785.1 hypothetical protein BEWA_026340 [Theileria equi strain WA]|eukprot:XP_004829451.1 hypothetical protein BEWA_026340 [Theileria equi strain WA]
MASRDGVSSDSGGQQGGVNPKAKTDPKKGLKDAAAFFIGIAMFQVFYITLSSGKFTLERFKIPPSHISIYINRMVISYRIFSFLGVFAVLIYDLGYGQHFGPVRRCLLLLLAFFYFVIILVYHIGGEQGYVTLFYWVIAISAFLVGSSYTLAAKIASDNIQYLLVSLPISKVLTFFYQLGFLTIWEYFGLSDTYYWMVVWQAIIAIFLCALTACLWIPGFEVEEGSQLSEKGENKPESTEKDDEGPHNAYNIFDSCMRAISPVLMSTLGFGLQNAFYPGVSPYKLTGIDQGFKITMVILFTSGIPSLVNLGLTSKGIGPNRPWTGGDRIWHGAWLFFCIQVICAIIFVCGLHYPGWPLSRAIRSDARILGLVTVIYDLCLQITYVIGTSGITKQGGKSPLKVSTVRIFTLTFAQISAAFIGDGYVKIYSKHENNRNNWPTAHYSVLRAFWFWTWNTTKIALSNVGKAFTIDLRKDILVKKEHLFIVYDDAPPEDDDPLLDLPFIHKKEESPDNHSFKGAHIFH